MTKIEWTDATWNPVTGCTKVSPGCAYCYAERLTLRFGGKPFLPGQAEIKLHPERLDAPLRWKKPRMIFVNSMSDLFHEDVPDEFIDRVWAIMALAGCGRSRCKGGSRCKHDPYDSTGCWMQGDGTEEPTHTFQILTKRPDRMLHYLRERTNDMDPIFDAAQHFGFADMGDSIGLLGWPLPNVWLGVSVENQRWADARIPLLLVTPAAVRFVSCEPLLGPLELSPWLTKENRTVFTDDGFIEGQETLTLDWVIVGGESGGPPERRLVYPVLLPKYGFGQPYKTVWGPRQDANSYSYDYTQQRFVLRHDGSDGGPLAWVRSIRDQCVAAAVPFFFKQWGGPRSTSGGRELDGRTWDEFPE